MPGKNAIFAILCAIQSAILSITCPISGADFERVLYNNPGLTVDLGVGLWANPMPLDWDNDGDLDLLVSTTDKPYNGIYFFENGQGNVKLPVFKPAKRIGDAVPEVRISYVRDGFEILTPGKRHPEFRTKVLAGGVPIPFEPDFYHGRANQWQVADYDGDGVNDLIIAVSDWREYGWDNAFDSRGVWTNGPIYGRIYVIKNSGSDENPIYKNPHLIMTQAGPLNVYGRPSPNFADFDGDGDLDIICGEFIDKMTYFENIGTRREPLYSVGRYLTDGGAIITMDLEMIVPVAIDWDRDGDVDLIVGDEDGRVAILENTGGWENRAPHFLPPVYFGQEAHELKAGALTTPYSIDWDGDGDEDIICGNTAGYLCYIENLDGGSPPVWERPRYLKTGGKVFRIMAGYNGSIQGPAEAKWGYTVCSVADWDHDGLPDIVLNSIIGKVVWLRNSGTRGEPALENPRAVTVAWKEKAPKPAWNWWNPADGELVTQWRTTPFVIDVNEDGLNDLVMLDHEGYLAFYERVRHGDELVLNPGRRVFLDESGEELRLNDRKAGGSGRRKFTLCDWDKDGKIDILINSVNINLLKNVGDESRPFMFRDDGPLGERILAGHTTSPTTVDWNLDGIPDLLAGAEDGFFYYLENPLAK